MINKKYYIVSAIYAKGESLNPEAVSSALKLSPTETRIKGALRRLPSGGGIVAPIGLWVLREESYSESLDGFIVEWISRYYSIGERRSSLQGVEDLFLDLFISVVGDRDSGTNLDFTLQPETIDKMAEIGMPIKFTINISNDE
ncbi:DUF4279 domain-containing protein [Pseudomonas sp. HR96]|uniref:DUF4279 domain-containing protein n=1 Tax=Pseudomonas sp. HR96 TaxID=1027966 RepID=UPI002A765F4F|nr:DUF4279 domain-containing protein [Pseudomonas sp. HR96]WPO98300.1 DUF4279 domain-containing protein [Pseudomonas sp. HR96]